MRRATRPQFHHVVEVDGTRRSIRSPACRRRCADPDKALVMSYLDQLVTNGYAEWSERSDGDLELRFNSGQRHLLLRRRAASIPKFRATRMRYAVGSRGGPFSGQTVSAWRQES